MNYSHLKKKKGNFFFFFFFRFVRTIENGAKLSASLGRYMTNIGTISVAYLRFECAECKRHSSREIPPQARFAGCLLGDRMGGTCGLGTLKLYLRGQGPFR